MFVGSCLEEYVIALLTFVAGDGIGKDDFVGVADMGFAGCVGDGGGDVVFLFFQSLLSPFFIVDVSEIKKSPQSYLRRRVFARVTTSVRFLLARGNLGRYV